MPSLTPKALAVERAQARHDGIQQARDLLSSLGAVSASVAAGAIAGLAQDALHDLHVAGGELAAETKAKNAKQPKPDA